MAEQILNNRSSLLYDRPLPTRLGAAEIAINYNAVDPGLYFADNTASPSTGLIKVGPTFVGSTAPNVTPTGYALLSKGESWLDTASTQILKIYDGTTWQTPKAVASIEGDYLGQDRGKMALLRTRPMGSIAIPSKPDALASN